MPSPIRPVLVVDHDAEICDHVTMALRDQGYLVHRAEQGAQAIETIDKEAFAIIFLDVSMPVIDGREFVRAYRSVPGHQPHLVVMTAERDIQEYAEQIDADAYIVKPLDADQILETVSELINRTGRP